MMSSRRCVSWRKVGASRRSARPGWIIIICRVRQSRNERKTQVISRALQAETDDEIESGIHDGALKSKQASLFSAATRSCGRAPS